MPTLGWGCLEQGPIQKAFWAKARIPLSAWPKGSPNKDLLIKRFGPATPETLIPITFKPENFLL